METSFSLVIFNSCRANALRLNMKQEQEVVENNDARKINSDNKVYIYILFKKKKILRNKTEK